jgi:hypothetical protein
MPTIGTLTIERIVEEYEWYVQITDEETGKVRVLPPGVADDLGLSIQTAAEMPPECHYGACDRNADTSGVCSVHDDEQWASRGLG